MEQLPVNFNIKDRPVAVIGGGIMAARRAELALRAGAEVSVYSETLSEEFEPLAERLTHVPRAVEAADLEGCALAFGASEDEAANERLHGLASAARVPVNVADWPELCDFIMPSIVDRSPLVISISTAGASPILGRMIRARLESVVPAGYGRLAAFVGRRRRQVAERIAGATARRRFWERLLEGPVADLVLTGHEDRAEELFRGALESGGEKTGEVYLVGAGPGDPDLLTFAAFRLMQRADVVLYDRLVDEAILNLVRRDAERIYVGKLPKEHTLPQQDISRMLVRLAREGKRVLRLKGGDPFIFGRGGEEIEVLAEHGVPFRVVPGITAAAGCAAYAGIPLTHRDHAQACIFVTGHGKDGELDLNWDALVQPRQTVAVYMGLSSLDELMQGFIDHGAEPATPAAAIENGTRGSQRIVTGTLDTLAAKAAEAGFAGPAMIIVGTVVTLRGKLDWFAPTGASAVPAETDLSLGCG